MFDFFYPRIPQEPYPYQPLNYGNKVGYQCPICTQPIIHHTSISLCQCRIFTHRKCFMKYFPNNPIKKNLTSQLQIELKNEKINLDSVKERNSENATQVYTIRNPLKQQKTKQIIQYNPQFSKIICQVCNSEVQLFYQSSIKFKPHVKPLINFLFFLVLIILFIIEVVALTFGCIRGYRFSYLMGICYVLILTLILLCVFGVTVLMTKIYVLTGVKTTDRSLQISAFEGIGIHHEDTKQQLFKDSL